MHRGKALVLALIMGMGASACLPIGTSTSKGQCVLVQGSADEVSPTAWAEWVRWVSSSDVTYSHHIWRGDENTKVVGYSKAEDSRLYTTMACALHSTSGT